MKIHFISIGGSIMHQLALSLHKKGHQITGSDDEIYEPSRSILKKAGLLPQEMGWFTQNITTDLDAVVLGMHARKDNPELLEAQKLGIRIYSYPEYIYQESQKKTRVVIAGSHGKTSTTALLMHVFKKLGKKFDYLVGARLDNFATSVQLTNAPLMILEGDEYLSSPIHPVPKIHYYQPQIVMLTGIAWDHMNVFPTYANYLEQFRGFLANLSNDASLVYNSEDEEVVKLVKEFSHFKAIPYHTHAFTQTAGQCSLIIEEEIGKLLPLQIFGKHNIQNLSGALQIAKLLDISKTDFYAAVQSFKGASKRLDLIGQSADSVFYRDFAHAPSKVKATTQAVKALYPSRKLTACFELHTYSSLNKTFLPEYAHSLDAADEAVVFFSPHTLAMKKLPPLDENQIMTAFKNDNLHIFTKKEALFDYLKQKKWKNKNLLMMSSGTFDKLNITDVCNFVTSG